MRVREVSIDYWGGSSMLCRIDEGSAHPPHRSNEY